MEKASVSDKVEARVIPAQGASSASSDVYTGGPAKSSVQGKTPPPGSPELYAKPSAGRVQGAAQSAAQSAPVVRDTIRPDTPYTPYQLTPMQHLTAARSSARRLGNLTLDANEASLDDEGFLQELKLEWEELASHVGVLWKKGAISTSSSSRPGSNFPLPRSALPLDRASSSNSALRAPGPRTPPVPVSAYARNVR